MGPGTFVKNLKWFGLTVVGAILSGLAIFQAAPMIAKKPIIVLGLPFVGALAIIMIINFHLMIAILIGTRSLLDPILNFTKVGGGAGLGALLNLMVIGLVLVMCFRYRSVFEGRKYWWTSWVGFMLIALGTAFYSQEPKQAIRLIINFLTYFCMFCAPLFLIRDKKGEKFWFKWLAITSVFPVLMADVGLVTRLPILNYSGRLSGTFSHPNILAFFLVYVQALLLYILKCGKFDLSPGHRFLMLMHGLNATLLLVFTQTRSAWICCAILFLFYGLLRDRRIVFACLFLAALLALAPPVQERLADLTQGTGERRSDQLNSWAWRVKLWENSFAEIKKNVLTGRGLGSFQTLSPEFGGLHRGESAPAHNIYVELLFETGIFGLLAFVSIFVRIMKRLLIRMRSRSPDGDGATVAFFYLLGYLFVSFSDNTLYYLSMNWYLWFFTGLVLVQGPQEIPSPAAEEKAA